MRRIGIVALARKLLIALWRYLEDGVIRQGARLIAPEIDVVSDIDALAPVAVSE